MEYQLAQINIGRILGPIDSPVMAEFVANLDRINSLAEKSPGFIWRLKDDNNNATSIKIYNDDSLIVNMSVWKDLETLMNFVYKSAHVEILKRNREWFSKLKEMHMALWYVPSGHTPSVEEAIGRLDHLRTHGETPHAFSFRKKFSIEEYDAFQNKNM
jgi:hypothetical protein